jgi:diaminopimelate decarboxylase
METLKFLSPEQAEMVRHRFGTPVYVYDERTLKSQAREALGFPNAFGLTARYAMKACPNAAIIRIFAECGLHIDASSGYECERALRAGVPAGHISLSTQEFPGNFRRLYEGGIRFNACSLNQLRRFGEQFPGGEVGLRFNPGLGSGGTVKTNVGGPASSFGIWHEYRGEARAIVDEHGLRVVRIHTHIGSGSDPAVWQRVARLSLEMVREFPEVTTLNLGGGYKIGRMSYEQSTDFQEIGEPIKEAFEELAEETGRRIQLEIEPGTYLTANACSLVATIQDIADTGEGGYRFLKLDTGMTEILRPSLYASQHPIIVLPRVDTGVCVPYVAVGHCCESGDLITPAPENHEVLHPRELPEAEPGDLCVIEGAGAYCSAMAAKNYNSFPEAAEVLVREMGDVVLIRRRQTVEQMVENEVEGISDFGFRVSD